MSSFPVTDTTLNRGIQDWRQHPRCGLISTNQRGSITSFPPWPHPSKCIIDWCPIWCPPGPLGSSLSSCLDCAGACSYSFTGAELCNSLCWTPWDSCQLIYPVCWCPRKDQHCHLVYQPPCFVSSSNLLKVDPLSHHVGHWCWTLSSSALTRGFTMSISWASWCCWHVRTMWEAVTKALLNSKHTGLVPLPSSTKPVISPLKALQLVKHDFYFVTQQQLLQFTFLSSDHWKLFPFSSKLLGFFSW